MFVAVCLDGSGCALCCVTFKSFPNVLPTPSTKGEKVRFSTEYMAFGDQTEPADESVMTLTAALSFNTPFEYG